MLEQYFSIPERTLYHYTGFPALMGMMDKKEVWASSIHYMNDALELDHACDILQELIRPRVAFASDPDTREIGPQFSEWLQTIKGATDRTICIVSLSSEANLLSQWRSYTPPGKGVCLGFSKEVLKYIVEDQGFTLGRCVYEEREQQAFLSEVFSRVCAVAIRERARESPRQVTKDYDYHSIFKHFEDQILPCLALIKHYSFREEQEWRLLSRLKYSLEGCRFRDGKSMLVPYVPIPLCEGKLFDTVTLGPTEHSELSLASLRAYLGEVCDSVGPCGTPYRVIAP